MIEELKKKILSDPNVPDVVPGVLGVSVGTAGAADLTGMIDLFANTFSTLLTLSALVVTVLTGINVWYRSKQIKIKTARDQLELEKSRLELEQLRKTYTAQKD